MSSSSNFTSSSNSTSSSKAGIAPIWFGVFEAVFVVAFIGISVAVHLLGVLKTDDDAVTIYHKIHKEIIAQQERNFMAQKKENFL